MWETIAQILTSTNAPTILLCLIVILILIAIFAKLGLISFHVKGVHIGGGVKEREVIRQQAAWAHTFVCGLEADITELCKNVPEYNPYKTKYVLETVYDLVIEWITYNHITTDPDYIKIKQDLMRAYVKSLCLSDYVATPKFYKQVDAWTAVIIENLVKIKETYS